MSTGSPSNNQISYPSTKEIAQKWTAITEKKLKENITKLKIIDKGTLIYSLASKVVRVGDISLQAQFTYRQYGQYVDMGVGRGVARGARKTAAFTLNRNAKGQLLRYKRKPRPWYSKPMFKEMVILGNIMSKTIAERTGQLIYQLPRKIEI